MTSRPGARHETPGAVGRAVVESGAELCAGRHGSYSASTNAVDRRDLDRPPPVGCVCTWEHMASRHPN
ncbi:MAG: hypothetical protein ACI9K5_003697 [Gammaproteobacteria bacterium]|jgi:hypothetical protein